MTSAIESANTSNGSGASASGFVGRAASNPGSFTAMCASHLSTADTNENVASPTTAEVTSAQKPFGKASAGRLPSVKELEKNGRAVASNAVLSSLPQVLDSLPVQIPEPLSAVPNLGPQNFAAGASSVLTAGGNTVDTSGLNLLPAQLSAGFSTPGRVPEPTSSAPVSTLLLDSAISAPTDRVGTGALSTWAATVSGQQESASSLPVRTMADSQNQISGAILAASQTADNRIVSAVTVGNSERMAELQNAPSDLGQLVSAAENSQNQTSNSIPAIPQTADSHASSDGTSVNIGEEAPPQPALFWQPASPDANPQNEISSSVLASAQTNANQNAALESISQFTNVLGSVPTSGTLAPQLLASPTGSDPVATIISEVAGGVSRAFQDLPGVGSSSSSTPGSSIQGSSTQSQNKSAAQSATGETSDKVQPATLPAPALITPMIPQPELKPSPAQQPAAVKTSPAIAQKPPSATQPPVNNLSSASGLHQTSSSFEPQLPSIPAANPWANFSVVPPPNPARHANALPVTGTNPGLNTVPPAPAGDSGATRQMVMPTSAGNNSQSDPSGGGTSDSSPRKGLASVAAQTSVPAASSQSSATTLAESSAQLAMPGASQPGAPDFSRKSDTGGPPDAPAHLPASAEFPLSPGTVQMAHMATKAAQSEMRIGMNTSAFGNVEVRTVVHANDVGVVIGSERGDLRSLLSNELPGVSSSLQQQNLRLHEVSFHQQGFAFSNQMSSGSDSQPRSFPSRNLVPTVRSPEMSSAEANESGETLRSVRGGQLSILA